MLKIGQTGLGLGYGGFGNGDWTEVLLDIWVVSVDGGGLEGGNAVALTPFCQIYLATSGYLATAACWSPEREAI